MTQLPAGISPIQYANYIAQLQTASQRQQQQFANQQQSSNALQGQLALQQQAGAQTAGSQQFALLLQLLQQQSQANLDAKNANSQTQNQIQDRDLATRNRLLDYVSQYGQSTLDDVNRADKSLRGRDTANMAAAGFLGASPDIMRGADIVDTRALLDNLNKAKDSLLQNAMSVDQNATNRLSDDQERVTNAYPDQSSINSLVSQLGAMLPGAGGGIGGATGGIGGQSTLETLTPAQKMAAGISINGPGAVTITPHLTQPGPAPAPLPTGYDIGRMNAAKMQQPQQLPWNYGNYPGANPLSQVQPFTSANGQMVPLRQSMPALGIFGGQTQMAYTPPNYGSPYGVSPTIQYAGSGSNVARGQNSYYKQRLANADSQSRAAGPASWNRYENPYSQDNPFGPNSPYGTSPSATQSPQDPNGYQTSYGSQGSIYDQLGMYGMG